jgi:uncharacterized membrane protein YsdA (DUF1294 family)
VPEAAVPHPPARPFLLRAFRVLSFFVATVFLAAACAAFDLRMVSPWVPIGYLAMSLLTMSAYGLDKEKAERGEWRTTEQLLHVLAVAGGWPGAILAQQLFRHKTRKPWFQSVTWLVIAAHIGIWTWAIMDHRLPLPKILGGQLER